MRGLPDEHAGAASGLLQMDQQIGDALGMAVIISIYAFAVVPEQHASGLPAAFGGDALKALVAALIAWRASRGRTNR